MKTPTINYRASKLAFILAMIFAVSVTCKYSSALEQVRIGTDTLHGVAINPPDANGRFGQSVSDAGDVNGDGFDDIIIGAVGYPYLAGKAFVFLGNPGVETNPDLVLSNGEFFFGGSVSKAGDVNGDGYSDVIAGVGHYVFSTNGTVHIYFGSANMDNIPDIVIPQGGKSVSNAGDVNGDGFDDVITSGGYIYFGGTSMDNIPDVVVGGYPVSDAGDANGDGFDDVIVAAAWPTAHLYFGGVNMDNIPDLIINANEELYDFQVSDAGDINGDGFADVMIATPGGGLFRVGKVFIYFGGLSMDNIADIILNGTENFQNTGYRISSAGDINGDGFSDVMSGMHSAKVHLYFGGPSMDNIPDAVMPALPHNMPPDMWVSSAGDFDGDGVPEMLVGIGASNYPTGVATLYDIDWDPGAPLNGTYTVGTGGLFPSITSAVNKLNENGVSGNVVFEIIAGTYQDTIVIDTLFGAGPLRKIKFRSQSGNKDVFIEGNHINLTINGADFLEFEKLTFRGRLGNAVQLEGNVEDVVFFDNAFLRFQGINSTEQCITKNLRIKNNTFICNENYPAIQHAVSLAGHSINTGILNNYISVNASGMILDNQDSLAFEDNNMSSSSNSMNISYEPGLSISNCRGFFSLVRSSVTKSLFRAGGLAVRISNCNLQDQLVANNSFDGGRALNVDNSTGILFLHNKMDVYPDPGEYCNSFSSCSSMTFANNIVERREGRYGLGKYYYIDDSQINCDHNNFFDRYQMFAVDSLFAIIDGNAINKLMQWKTQTGLDMNSTQEKVFSNGIHLKKPSSYNPKLTGVYLGVLTDIDGEPRSVTSPFKGPDEPQNVQPAISCFISGDDFIPANQSGIYIQDSLNGGLWEIGNQTANASIEQSNEYACILNSGSLGGNFRLYYNGYDSATGTYQTYCDKLIRVDSPSPVELVSFATFLQGNRVRLEWITTTELNNSGFEIERRVESGKIRVESWSQIGFVNGSGTTSEPKEYSYMDRNLETGKYNYRLKQLDFNGNFEYFELPEVVSIGIPDKYDLSQNYPNPFNPYTTIVFGIPQSDNVVLKIFDTAGREVKTLVNEFKEAGYYVARFDGSSLASGTYIYRIESGSFVSARKMVLLK